MGCRMLSYPVICYVNSVTAETYVLANSCSIIAAGLPIASWGMWGGGGNNVSNSKSTGLREEVN